MRLSHIVASVRGRLRYAGVLDEADFRERQAGGEESWTHSGYGGKDQFILKVDRKEVGEVAVVKREDGDYEISNIMVWPAFQRQGYGTRFYQKAHEFAKSKGKRLFISDDLTSDAKAIHKKLKAKGILKDSGELVFRKASLLRQAILRQKVDEKDGKKKWALLSRKKPHRVLKWFGSQKPSEETVQKEEKRIQYFKNRGGGVIDALRRSIEFEQVNDDPHTVAGILFLCQGRILLLRRSEGEDDEAYWSIPGGHVKVRTKGSPPDLWGNALRECKEELGSIPPGTGRATRKHTRTEKKSQNRYVTFVVELPPGALKWKPQLSAEHDGYMWVTKAQAKNLPIHPGVKKVLYNEHIWAGKIVIPLQIALQRQAEQSLVEVLRDHNERVRNMNRIAGTVFHKMAKDLRFIRLDLMEVVHGPTGATPVAGVAGVMRYGNHPELFFDVSVSPREAGRVRVYLRTKKTGYRKGVTVPASRLGDIPGWILTKLEEAIKQEA